jgi:hypothetical protein
MFKRPMAIAGSLVLALAGLAGTASLAQASPAAGRCRHVTGPFHEHRNEITSPAGQRYIPYGIVVTGLGNPNWARRQSGDAAEISASAASWCANTVELQVYQLAMFNADGSVNSTFLGKNGLDQGAGNQIMQFFRKYNS